MHSQKLFISFNQAENKLTNPRKAWQGARTQEATAFENSSYKRNAQHDDSLVIISF
jgi:hypothetical protein